MEIPIELLANFDDHLSDKNVVFHYTSFDAVAKHIIPSMKLRFGKITKANDPKEFTNLNPSISRSGKSTMTSDDVFKQARNEFNLATHADVKMLCFCRNTKLKGYIKPRMWAQYGRQMSGVCIALSKKQLAEDARLKLVPTWSRNIKYTYSLGNNLDHCRIAIKGPKSERDIKAQVARRALEVIPKVYFDKFVDFRDEAEWRIVCTSKTTQHLDISKSIISIIVGSKVSESQIQTLTNVCPSVIEIQQIDWNPQGPTLIPRTDPNGRIKTRLQTLNEQQLSD